MELQIYRDVRRLQGGDFYNRELARSLYESVCMIMIYTPTYFSAEQLYCTREFAAMATLCGDATRASSQGPGFGATRRNARSRCPAILAGKR